MEHVSRLAKEHDALFSEVSVLKVSPDLSLLNMKSPSSPGPITDPLANGFLPVLLCTVILLADTAFLQFGFVSQSLRSGRFHCQ